MSGSPDIASSFNLSFLEQLYGDFVRDRTSVSPEWVRFFENFKTGERLQTPREALPAVAPGAQEEARIADVQSRLFQLVRNYRVRGHNVAEIDPLGLPRPSPPELALSFSGFSEDDLDLQVRSDPLQRPGVLTLREVLSVLKDTYTRSIGVQYMHIDDLGIRRWLQQRMEGTSNRLQLTRQEQIRIFTRLIDAVSFEQFVRRKFVGAKSFSLEGCESLIPLLDLAIEKMADQGIREIVLGMAHRGRLNVLANIIGKSPRQIFREFADPPQAQATHGDVKYHLGYSNEWETGSGKRVHLSLCFNPSHLEFVDPVALGRVRAKQDRSGDRDGNHCMALLIHGDASFAAQGLVQETLNLSRLPGYTVHGTLHIVVNNQIGFTTSPHEARSSAYPTDVAKMLQIPIFHVNGEDPEAVAQVVRLALDFRETFRRDVVIDMYGYRRLGHNEGDEPSFTQPVLYRAIGQRKSVLEGYLDHLLRLGGLTREEAQNLTRSRQEELERELSESQTESYKPPLKAIKGIWKRGGYFGGLEKNAEKVPTGVPESRLSELLDRQTHLPLSFSAHPKIERWLENRRSMAAGKTPLDWAAAESLAFASLSVEGFRIRLSGQDSARGTFSQRHAILYDYHDGKPYVPLQHLSPDQAPVEIINSPLSESGVLGFDYGYSLDCPDGLTCWEAQFGDFVNAAQVIVDQFIASAEDKWKRLSGIVLLLPHGFEGQGPEHSHARLERFLGLAAQDNIQIVYPTTPAQYFHCLRRQMLRRWRKPLIVMTPKSLLRHPRAVSSLADCANGRFELLMGDPEIAPGKTRRILLCSGKIYYELCDRRKELARDDVAVVRVEQLYPLPDSVLETALAAYRSGTPMVWVQEEPENMGAWRTFRARFDQTVLGKFPLSGIYRPASASPASGSARVHKQEQAHLITEAFSGL